MGLTLKVTMDAYLVEQLAGIAQITGQRSEWEIMADAISFTESALRKAAEHFTIHVVRQSIGQDHFSYPINPLHLYQDMKQEKPQPGDTTMPLRCAPHLQASLHAICHFLKTDRLDDAARFSVLFAHHIATQLNQSPGMTCLTYIDPRDRRFGVVAKTPYDKSLRLGFNRLVNYVQHLWQDYTGPAHGPNDPPLPPPGPR